MPKKISVIEMRQWLQLYEQGKVEASIARDAKRDIKTVKRGIEQARLERDAAAARSELLKHSLRQHQDKLLAVLAGVLSALVAPSPELPVTTNKSGGLERANLAEATIYYDSEKGLVLDLNGEATPHWQLLREHLKRDRMWKMLDRWKAAMVEHIRARLELRRETESLLKDKTGYDFQYGEASPPYLYPRTSVDVLYLAAMKHVISGQITEDLDAMIIADTARGVVRYGAGTLLAEAPGDEDRCRASILEAYDELIEADEAAAVASTCRDVEVAILKARPLVEEVSLLGMVPGKCRVCRRLGI